MSDNILAIFGMGSLFGMLMTVAIIGALWNDHDKRAHDIDLDMRIYTPHRDRECGGMDRDYKGDQE